MSSADPGHAARRAAHLLGRLRSDEQALLLARLDPPDAQRITQLMSEAPPPSVEDAGGAAQERVWAMPANAALHALMQCSSQTAALVIGAAAWPWREQVLRRMPQPRRATVVGLVGRPRNALPAAVLAVLCECMLRAAKAEPASPTLSNIFPPAWRDRLRAAFGMGMGRNPWTS